MIQKEKLRFSQCDTGRLNLCANCWKLFREDLGHFSSSTLMGHCTVAVCKSSHQAWQEVLDILVGKTLPAVQKWARCGLRVADAASFVVSSVSPCAVTIEDGTCLSQRQRCALGPDFPVGPSEHQDFYNRVTYQILSNIIHCSCWPGFSSPRETSFHTVPVSSFVLSTVWEPLPWWYSYYISGGQNCADSIIISNLPTKPNLPNTFFEFLWHWSFSAITKPPLFMGTSSAKVIKCLWR